MSNRRGESTLKTAVLGVTAVVAVALTWVALQRRKRRIPPTDHTATESGTKLSSNPPPSKVNAEPQVSPPVGVPSSSHTSAPPELHAHSANRAPPSVASVHVASDASASRGDDDAVGQDTASFPDDAFTRNSAPPVFNEAKLVLIITAPQRSSGSEAKSKLRSLARTAAAFEASEVVFSGLTPAAQSELRVPRSTSCRFTYSGEVGSVAARLKSQQQHQSPDALHGGPQQQPQFAPPPPPKVAVIGLDIMPGAMSVDSPAFAAKLQQAQVVCLVAGADSAGLSDEAKASCDWFCYVPQLRTAATLSAHTNIAIALHRVASAAGVRSAVGVMQGGRSLSDGGTGTIVSEDASLAACDDEQEVMQAMAGTSNMPLMHSDSDLSESQNRSASLPEGPRRRWSPPGTGPWSAMQSPAKPSQRTVAETTEPASPNARDPGDFDGRPLHGTDSMVSMGSFHQPSRSTFSRSAANRASQSVPSGQTVRGKSFTFSRGAAAADDAALSPDLAAMLASQRAGEGSDTCGTAESSPTASPVASRRPAAPPPPRSQGPHVRQGVTVVTRIDASRHHTGSSRRWTPHGYEEDF